MAPLRQNIGYQASMFSPTKGTAMIMSQEQALLKAQAQLDQLIESVHSAVEQCNRIDQVERDLIARLLDLGLTLLNLFVARHGDGDLGATAETVEGQTVQRLPLIHDRRYVSIFGELAIPRVVYGTREGQKVELAPLDKSLGLPAGDFSYVVEDWAQRFSLKGSFAEAAESLQTLLRLRIGVHTLERMSQEMADSVVPFREAIEPPPAAEEGPILVVTADGKGVPMRRPAQDGPKPHHRRTKGEKANKKQMACVGAVYSIEPFVRTADDILDEVIRHEKAEGRPEPAHKHVWAEMSRDVEGEPLNAKDAIFGALFQDLNLRNAGHDRPVVCLMDGERALWEAQRVYFSEAVGILDLFHVMERLWTAAHCFHAEGSDAAEGFVADRLRGLLEGRVGPCHRRTSPAVDQASTDRVASQDVGLGDHVPGEQPGAHAVRRLFEGGLPDRQRRGRRSLPPPGQGPDGADGDALDRFGGASDAPSPSDLPERSMGGLRRRPDRTATNQAVWEKCGIALSGLHPFDLTDSAWAAGSAGAMGTEGIPILLAVDGAGVLYAEAPPFGRILIVCSPTASSWA